MAIGLDEALRVAHNERERAGGPHSEPGGLAMQALLDSAADQLPRRQRRGAARRASSLGMAIKQPCAASRHPCGAHTRIGRTYKRHEDAPEHLGAYIRRIQRRLAALGYESFCTFEHGEPHFHKLEE